MNIRSRNIPSWVLYVVSGAVLVAIASLLNLKEPVIGFIVCGAFWLVVAMDFWRTQVKENGESEVAVYARVTARRGVYIDKWGFVRVDYFGSPRTYEAATPEPQPDTPPAQPSNSFSFADRFIGYLFAAPAILPVRAYKFLRSRSGRV